MRKDKIKNKIIEINDSLELINKNMVNNYEDFLNLGIVKDGIYKRLEYSIENLLDILYILNSDLHLGTPFDDSNLIDNLNKNNLIDKNTAGIIKKMKGLRNIIVHRYSYIDDSMVYEFLKNDINDFYNIINIINSIVDKKDQ